MTGCVTCALEILARYQGTERDLMDEYRHTFSAVKGFLAGVGQVSQQVERVA